MLESDQPQTHNTHSQAKKWLQQLLLDALNFVVHTLVALLIVLLIIHIIFKMQPNDAHVYAELDSVEPDSAALVAADLKADVSEVALQSDTEFHNPAYFEIPSKGVGEVEKSDVLVTDFFGNDDYAAYVSAPKGTSIRITLAESDEADRWRIPDISKTIVVEPEIKDFYCQIGIKGDIRSMHFEDAFLVSDSKKREKHNGIFMPADQTILSDSTTFKYENDITITLDNYVRAYILYDDGSETPIDDDKITFRIPIENSEPPSMESDDTDGVPYHQLVDNEITLELVSDNSSNRLATFFPSYYVFKSNNVSRISATSSGQLTMSYITQLNEYVLQGQELALGSTGSQLKCTYDPVESTILCQGYVQTATLSRMNLFPSFKNWFFSNAYIAPLAIITSVFSALTQLKSFRKEGRENKTGSQSTKEDVSDS